MPDETPSDQPPLFDAAVRGDVRAVDALLQAGARVSVRHPDNQWTVLMAAAAFDRASVVSRLLDEPGVALNATGDRRQTALHIAAERGSEAAIRVLLQQPSLEVNVKDERGWTPLIWATFGGRLGVMQALLARPDVQVNLVDKDRQTAMHWAVLADHPEAARALLDRQELNLAITNRPGHHTPLDLARLLDRPALVVLLEAVDTRSGTDELAPGDSWPPPADDSAPRPLITWSIPEPPRWK